MPATTRAKQDRDDREGHELVSTRIREGVMKTLGSPDQLLGVQVRRLWAEFYRVNVFVGADSVTSRIAHSYFLSANENGDILVSFPPLCRVYGPKADCLVTKRSLIMGTLPEIQNIEEMRQLQGIDDVELRDAIRELRVADVVKLTFLTGPGTWETLPVRITGRRAGRFQGELAKSPSSARLAGFTAGSRVVFTRFHIHSVVKRREFAER